VTDILDFAAASVVNPPLWIELAAIVAGALAGSIFATRRGLDVVGVIAVAIVTGLGGAMIRDILLASIPAALTEPIYLLAVVIAATVGAFFGGAVAWLRWPMAGIDSLSLGLFAVVGTQKALSADLPEASAILLGVITGIGGSLLRDLFTGRTPPEAFQRGAPFASAALLAAGTYALLVRGIGTSKLVAEIVAIGLVILLRSAAAWRGWDTPTPRDLTPERLQRRRDEGEPGPGDSKG